MNGQQLQVVDKFTFLGSTLSRAVHLDDEVTARTAKASVTFVRLRTNVRERNGIRLDTMLKVYQRHFKRPFPLELPEKALKYNVARQDPRDRGHEEGKDAKRTNSIKACTAKMDWPCYMNA